MLSPVVSTKPKIVIKPRSAGAPAIKPRDFQAPQPQMFVPESEFQARPRFNRQKPEPAPEVTFLTPGFPRTVRAKHGVGPSEEGYELHAGKMYTTTGLHKHGRRTYFLIKQGRDEVAWGIEHFEELI